MWYYVYSLILLIIMRLANKQNQSSSTFLHAL